MAQRGDTPAGRRGRSVIDRRGFLIGAAALGASGLAAGCGWDGGPLRDDLVRFSRLNDWISAGLFSNRLAREYPVSQRTPERHFPAYSIVRPMPTLANPASWRLEVQGLVRRSVALSIEDVQRLPRLTYTVKHHCVEGWSAIGTWSGARFAALADVVQPLPTARYVLFRSFDAGYYNGWDMASAMHPQTILAYAFNDRTLGVDHGAPLRLYSPTKLGYKLTKYLTSIEFTAQRPGGYWEDRGYPWFGGV